MKGMAAPLSEDDMRHVAAFYAGKQAKPGAARNKATVMLGEKIYRGGIAERSIPACSGCHSPNGAGIPASTRGSPGSMPTTPRRSWWLSAAARAATARR
jgi:cytochrome c553